MSARLSAAAGEEPPHAEPIGAFFVVLNRGCREGGAREAIEKVFAEAGRRVEFVCIEPGEVAVACQRAGRAARDAGGALVAVGGDGTLNAATQAALANGCPLGVVPQGTFNMFARDHGLPLDPEEAARALLDAEIEPVQVGLLNGRAFLVNGSIGLYPQILKDREDFKQRLGRRRWVAVLSGLKTLVGWRRQLDVELELDGRIMQLRTPTLFVGNNRVQLEQAGVSPHEAQEVGHGQLVAMVARPQGRWAKLRWIARALVGQLAHSPEVDVHGLRSLTVAAPRHGVIHAATDGETVEMTPPLRFSVSPRPLLLLKPVG